MKKLILIGSILFCVFLFNSCTLEKRHHLSGYYIKWDRNSELHAMQPQPSTSPTPVRKKHSLSVHPIQAVASASPKTTITNVHRIEASSIVNVKPEFQTYQLSSIPFAAQAISNKTNEPAYKASHTFLKDAKTKLVEVYKQSTTSSKKVVAQKTSDWDTQMVVFHLLWSITLLGGIIHTVLAVNHSAK